MIKNEEDYYKPATVNNFCNSNYIEYERNSNGSKTLQIEEDLDHT